jgi:carboxylesterase type B
MNTTAKAEAEIKGLVDKRFSNQVVHYLGIQYASIAERFAISLLREGFGDKKDFTTFGPRCPQPPMNVAESMHVPKHIQQDPPESEDELLCCNLNVSCPLDSSATHLPVLFWIHGGGQATSYPTAQNRLGDPGPLVAHSIELGKPIILVTINYRLNIFGFGHEHSEKNVGLQDQMVALQWVKQNISQFRGDKACSICKPLKSLFIDLLRTILPLGVNLLEEAILMLSLPVGLGLNEQSLPPVLSIPPLRAPRDPAMS